MLGLSPSAAGLVSELELVEFFVARCNKQLDAELRKGAVQEQLQQLRITERVKMGVKMRLEMVTPFIGPFSLCLPVS